MELSDFTEHARVHFALKKLKAACDGKAFSDIVDGEGRQYVDLVMEGGGVLGIALVGYTYALEAIGLRFLRVGGTSAGSINAMLMAALDRPSAAKSERVLALLAGKDLYDFVDGDDDARDFVEALVGGAGKIKLAFKGVQVLDTLQEKMGINPGRAFLAWLTEVLSRAGVDTTAALQERIGDLPDGLRLRKGRRLTAKDIEPKVAIVSADVSTETKVEFPRMAPLYWADSAAVHPATYIRASMSIPFFFEPFCADKLPRGAAAMDAWKELAGYEERIPTRCLFVDGGVMSNFPIDLFHRPGRVPRAPTFGAKLGSDHRSSHEIDGPFQLAGAMFNAARHCLDYDFIKRNPDYNLVVSWIPTGDHNWIDFNLSDAAKVDLFANGVETASEFLREFDWPAYKRLRAALAKGQPA